ncbi:MAG: hypothetical protein N7Q72_07370, partial [Spiroplasma sp. Tabriz.8]|nr:hypothetical protein [Spiroplasma sp. Tabriz.8]
MEQIWFLRIQFGHSCRLSLSLSLSLSLLFFFSLCFFSLSLSFFLYICLSSKELRQSEKYDVIIE